jgi:hypothetical protein
VMERNGQRPSRSQVTRRWSKTLFVNAPFGRMAAPARYENRSFAIFQTGSKYRP